MKKKILHLCGFLILIGVLCTSFIITKPKKQVSADVITYFFEVDHSLTTQLSILLYVYDIANLQVDTCNMEVYLSQNSPPYSSTASAYSVQFVRDSSFDYDDYNCYRYTFVYPVFSSATPLLIILLCDHVLSFDNNTYVEYHLFIPYYQTYDTMRQEGYNDGYDDGEEDATIARDTYWEQYIDDEYVDPQGPGYQLIYQRGRSDGFSAGQQSLDTMSWFQTITSGVSNIFSLQLLPSITIGELIFIPLMFMILSGVLWIWRKK